MYDSYYDSSAVLGLYIASIVVGLLFAVAVYIVGAIFLQKLFTKAGVEKPVVAWIPIYNVMIFVKLGDLNPFLYLIAIGGTIVLSWIPLIGQIIGLATAAVFVMAAYRVNQKLQKDPILFTVFAVFLSIIWLGVIAFSKNPWNTASKPVEGIAPVPAPPWSSVAFFMDTTTFGGVPAQGYPVTPKPTPPAAPAA
jgi:hypothetical protein